MKSTRRGRFSVHRWEKTPGSKYSSTSGLSPRGHLERQAEFHASTQDEACLSCPQSAGTLRSESEIRSTLRFLPQLEMRPSSNAPNPVESRETPPTSSFPDRKSTRLNSSHQLISYAVFCLKKKKNHRNAQQITPTTDPQNQNHTKQKTP